MAAQSESFSAPVATLLTAPLSLSFPLLALWFLGFSITFPVLIGMIILTGIVVNNVILIVDKARRRLAENPTDQSARAVRSAVLRSLRNRLRPLLLTSGTTLLGVLPLLIMGESGTSLLTALAFVVFWGIIGSLFTAMVLLPALTAVFPRLIALSAAAKAEGSKHAAHQGKLR